MKRTMKVNPRPNSADRISFAPESIVCVLEIPGLELVSLANMRGMHWGAKAKIVKRQREMVLASALTQARTLVEQAVVLEQGGSATVTLQRFYAKGRSFDSDNLQGAFKSVRDQVAEALGIDDRSKAVTWKYEQALSDKQWSKTLRIPYVLITIEAVA